MPAMLLLLTFLCTNFVLSRAFWDYADGFADCSGGHVRLNETCYILSKQQASWHSALNRCNENGMTMARVDSKEKHDTVSMFLSTKFNPHTFTWLDIIYDDALGAYVHKSNDDPVSESFWNPGEPSSDDEFCVAQHAYGWMDADCGIEINFLCQSQGCPCPDVEVHRPDTIHCTNDRLYFGGDTCYHISEQSVNFEDARSSCEAIGGKLARLNLDVKYKNLFAYIGNLPYGKWRGFWAAAERNFDTNTFVYDDGTEVDEDIWSKGEPNNYMNSEHCAQTWYSYPSDMFMWNDVDCGNNFQYICEFKDCDRDICLQTTAAPTTVTHEADPLPGWSNDQTTEQTAGVSTTETVKNDGDSILDFLKSKGHVVSAPAMTVLLCCLFLFM